MQPYTPYDLYFHVAQFTFLMHIKKNKFPQLTPADRTTELSMGHAILYLHGFECLCSLKGITF